MWLCPLNFNIISVQKKSAWSRLVYVFIWSDIVGDIVECLTDNYFFRKDLDSNLSCFEWCCEQHIGPICLQTAGLSDLIELNCDMKPYLARLLLLRQLVIWYVVLWPEAVSESPIIVLMTGLNDLNVLNCDMKPYAAHFLAWFLWHCFWILSEWF